MTKVTVSLLIITLALASESNAKAHNVNTSQSGSVTITTVDGVIKCHDMICPPKSVGCSVSVETTYNLADVETVRICYDSKRLTLKEEKSTAPNPHPGMQISSYSDSSNTGVIQHFHYGNEENAAIDMSAQIDSMNKQMQEWQQKFQHEMNIFNTNLHKQIEDSIPHPVPK